MKETKAAEIVEKFYQIIKGSDACCADTQEEIDECSISCTGHGCPHWKKFAIQCAILHVDGIIEAIDNAFSGNIQSTPPAVRIYWSQIRAEIEKMK